MLGHHYYNANGSDDNSSEEVDCGDDKIFQSTTNIYNTILEYDNSVDVTSQLIIIGGNISLTMFEEERNISKAYYHHFILSQNSGLKFDYNILIYDTN